MKPVVSIIIVNWNGLDHLPNCLDSITAQTFRDFEVVLVDNGSEDGSLSFVREHYPWVKVIPLPENTGFASGNNHGFENSQGDYIVTLNNDTRVEPNWLEILVKNRAGNLKPKNSWKCKRHLKANLKKYFLDFIIRKAQPKII